MTQDWVCDLLLPINLLKDGLLLALVIFFALLHGGLFVDASYLFLVFERPQDIFLMERFGPSFWNPIFHFVLYGLLVWRPR